MIREKEFFLNKIPCFEELIVLYGVLKGRQLVERLSVFGHQ
jgi:hypothetical protein